MKNLNPVPEAKIVASLTKSTMNDTYKNPQTMEEDNKSINILYRIFATNLLGRKSP